jgi:hypothetical protein
MWIMTLDVDTNLLKEFEESLDPTNPEESPIPARVLGYGEISTVFEILDDSQKNLAFKRMPLFDSIEQVRSYKETYNRYNELLNSIGIDIPEFGAEEVVTEDDRIVLYLYQKMIPSQAIGNNLIHTESDEHIMELVETILEYLNKVWAFNESESPHLQLAIDGQVSNWAVKEYCEGLEINKGIPLLYLDTSTPLMKENEIEQLNTQLFLKPAPPIMRWILKKFYLQDIVDKYYDFRRVVLDLVANFYKEQRPDLIPNLIKLVNHFFSENAVIKELVPLSSDEVKDYYDDDASTWRLYLRVRKFHRYVSTKILRRYYDYILPGEIQR